MVTVLIVTYLFICIVSLTIVPIPTIIHLFFPRKIIFFFHTNGRSDSNASLLVNQVDFYPSVFYESEDKGTAARIVLTIETCQIINHPRFWFLDLSGKKNKLLRVEAWLDRVHAASKACISLRLVLVLAKFSWQSFASLSVLRDSFAVFGLTLLVKMHFRGNALSVSLLSGLISRLRGNSLSLSSSKL